MRSFESPLLTADEIDDLLYFTRVNEAHELQQLISELTPKYNCSEAQLLQAAVDPETGNNVLHYASANGLAELLKMLLSKVGEQGETATEIDTNDSPTAVFMNDTNKQGNTPLHWAAYNGHLEAVKLLVEAKADMWKKNNAGHLAMFEAERAEKGDVVQYLLSAGSEEATKAGTEKKPTAEDVTDVQNGEMDGPNDAERTNDDVDVVMGAAGPSGG